MLLSVLPCLCTFAPSNNHFAAVFYNVLGARTLYIREKTKTSLFDVCSRFPSYMYVCTIFRFWYVCSRLLIRFSYLDYF